MKVLIMGSGIAGITTAYFLARSGCQVTIIDKNSHVAMGCSYANGGQLSYSHIETWSTRSSMFYMIKSALSPNSFLSISDLFDIKFLKWLYEFYKNSNSQISEENSKNLAELSRYSKEILSLILLEEEINFDYKQEGILHFYRNKKLFQKSIQNLSKSYNKNISYKILDAKSCVEKEPTLTKLFDNNKLVGGILYDQDESGNSMLFARSLEKILKEKYGVAFEYNTEIKNILNNRKKITGINTNKGVFTADNYVCTLGAYGDKLLKGIGINAKIYPIKGYSLSIPTDANFLSPKISLTDVENKIVYSRLGNTFRAAGTIEISKLNNKNNQKHINFLKENLFSSFSDFGNLNKAEEWFGFRPFRPNSTPLVCLVNKYQNLFLNIGHGHLGWTLSMACAKISSDLIVTNRINKAFKFLIKEGDNIY